MFSMFPVSIPKATELLEGLWTNMQRHNQLIKVCKRIEKQQAAVVAGLFELEEEEEEEEQIRTGRKS
jgi:hypothetical protein